MMDESMQGYNKEEAIAFILPRINRLHHAALADRIDDLIPQAIDADLRFMHETGVLDDNGESGGEYYEEDDALEYIVEALVAGNNLTPDQAVQVAALVDDFMDFQQDFMESRGLVGWEDE